MSRKGDETWGAPGHRVSEESPENSLELFPLQR